MFFFPGEFDSVDRLSNISQLSPIMYFLTLNPFSVMKIPLEMIQNDSMIDLTPRAEGILPASMGSSRSVCFGRKGTTSGAHSSQRYETRADMGQLEP